MNQHYGGNTIGQTIAEIGDEILFKNLIKGIVEKVNQNSVIVTITKNYTDLEFLYNRTVVSHKNYTIVKDYEKKHLF
ncbi:DUF2187 family protein [Neobacillus sp. PS3-40]|jgi:uncharacterized protein YkvS|uniref:YkvS family protein n=1 Tax=Neobacillus sp. PS3-40 TaxID=3070679 RepID=UPI0027E08A9B|nr:DUF2187 family protein [Neobacillus sp. PS3-40]WML44896.1 DUF2187 family protein [Neobacillus sp. PS3-40]